MTLFNQGWTTFGGDPITGRVPTEMIVYADRGVELNEEQLGAVLHAYKLFCDAIKVTAFPSGYHVQNRQHADGTRTRMTSNLEVHKVQVWIKGEGEKNIYRGFVLRPIWNAGDAEAGSPNTILLRYRDAKPDPVWENWVSPFHPGSSTETPTYFVDTIRSSHRIANGEIVSDQKYFDVYCLHNDKLYRNTRPAGGIPSSFGSPIVLRTADAPNTLFLADDTDVSVWIPPVEDPGSLESVFDRAAAIEILVPGYNFHAAVRYNQTPRELKYLTQNMTYAGALQAWNVTVSLSNATPWATAGAVEFEQMSVPTLLYSAGGYTSTFDQVPAAPIFGSSTGTASVCGYQYDVPPSGSSDENNLIGPVFGADVGVTPDTREYCYKYDKQLEQTDSLKLYDNWTAETSIGTTINSTTTYRFSCIWYNKWPNSLIYTGSSYPEDWTGWIQVPSDGSFAGEMSMGELFNESFAESAWVVANNETAWSTTTIGADNLDVIYDASMTHVIDHRITDNFDYIKVAPPAEQSLGGAGGDFQILHKVSGDVGAYVHYDQRTDHFTVSVTTKDFFYYDEDNSVKAWVEATVTGTRDVLPTDAGSSVVRIYLKIETPNFEAEQFFAEVTSTLGCRYSNKPPDDLNQDATPSQWTFLSPERADPVFSPLWQVQGMCPHLAYTTEAEHDATVPLIPRVLASFRLQLLMTDRVLNFYDGPLDVVPLEGTVSFRPYMLEQALKHFWRQGHIPVFQVLETMVAKLDAAHPRQEIHTDLDLPGIGDSLQTNYYRT